MEKIYKSITLKKIISKDYWNNYEKGCKKNNEEPCLICGKATNIDSSRTKWLQYNRDTDEITNYMGDIGSEDPECFPVGCECFKKFLQLAEDKYN